MARPCGVCRHPQLDEINAALLRSETLRKISETFSVSVSAAFRHKAEHISTGLQLARKAAQVASADTLLERVISLHARTLAILETAESEGRLETALRAIREARSNLELLAKLDGQLQDKERGPSTVNLVYSERTLVAQPAEIRQIEAGQKGQNPPPGEGVRALQSVSD